MFNFGRAGGFGVVQQKGQRSAGGQAWEEPGVWDDNLRAGVGNWRESWTTRAPHSVFPCTSKSLYRYSLIPRGPGSVERSRVTLVAVGNERAGRSCCAQIESARQEIRYLSACQNRYCVGALLSTSGVLFPGGGCQRDVLANLDSICQCCVGLFEREGRTSSVPRLCGDRQWSCVGKFQGRSSCVSSSLNGTGKIGVPMPAVLGER